MSDVTKEAEVPAATDEADEPATYVGEYAKPFALPREPIYEAGNLVRTVEDLLNDGSHPGSEEGALLAPKGSPGTIVRVGHAENTDVPVYLVEFPGGVLVGCLEEEIELASGVRRGIPGVME